MTHSQKPAREDTTPNLGDIVNAFVHGKVADGFVLDCGARDRGQLARAHQAGQWPGVTAVGLHPVARLLGNQGRGDDPADAAFWGEIPGEPVATGSRVIDNDEMWGVRVELPAEGSDVTWTGADGAQIDDLGVVIFGHRGHRQRILVPIEPTIEWARLAQG
jgi:hypothetical protein